MNSTPRLSGLQKSLCLPVSLRFSGRQAFRRLLFALEGEVVDLRRRTGVTAVRSGQLPDLRQSAVVSARRKPD
jgi:hypothetical protein